MSSSATGSEAALPPPLLAPGRVEHWQPALLSIDPWTVLRLARYKRRDSVEPAIWEAACRMAARTETLVTPRALLRIVRLAATAPHGVTLAEGPVFSGRAVTERLRGCACAVAFVLTIGPDLEAEAAALFEAHEPLDAFLLDTAGWAAIEATVRVLRLDLVTRVHDHGWHVAHRLGPGHGDWPLEEQRGLVSLFDDGAAPVRLSEHGMLLPLKSISGVFGIRRS